MRGQAAVEWIVIMGVAMLVLGVMLALNEDGYRFFQSSIRSSQAASATGQLADAADFVHSQGEGAKTRLYVFIPSATNISVETLSTGGGRISAASFNKGEFERFTTANLTGSLPNVRGSYNIDLEYDGEKVIISRSPE